MEVQVEYDYVAQEDDEISIRKGDILTNVLQKLDGWWEGTLGNKRGLFPDNFTRVISNGSDRGQQSDEDVFSEVVQLRNKKPSVRRLKVLFSYTPEQDDELALEVGDVIEFISDVEDGWQLGCKNGKRGIFPSNFVTDASESETLTNNGSSQDPVKTNLLAPTTNQKQNNINRATYIKEPPSEKSNSIADDEPPPQLPPKKDRERCRCIYPYTAQNDDELELNEGDIITIITKNCEDEGWWRGELGGRNGLFPDNFVLILSPNEPLTTSNSTFPQQKLLAQGRNITGLSGAGDSSVDHISKDLPDGATGSKLTDSKKNVPTKRDSKEYLPPANQSKSKSPPSPITATNPAFGLPTSSNRPPPVRGGSKEKDEEIKGDFNAVERSEKLSHLTASRAKAPKRRPPSTLLSREEHGMANGVDGTSLETSIDSPQNFNTSMNHNGTSSLNTSINSTPSTVFVSDTSNLSTPGQTRPLQNHYRETSENNSAQSPTTLNSAESSVGTPTTGNSLPSKPKKLLPWMAELQQKQDKKRELAKSPNSAPVISPTSSVSSPLGVANKVTGGSTSTSNSPMASSTPTPAFTSTPSLRSTPSIKEKDQVPSSKPPPLPAKPTDKIATSANNNSNNVSPVVPVVPTTATTITTTATTSTTPSSTISTFSLKFGGVRKTNSKEATNASSPSHTSNNFVNPVLNTITTPPNETNSTPMATTNNSINNKNGTTTPAKNTTTSDAFHNASGNKGNLNAMKPEFVPYEEFEKLQDRVKFLESELEATRKQLKLILQTADKGHIV